MKPLSGACFFGPCSDCDGWGMAPSLEPVPVCECECHKPKHKWSTWHQNKGAPAFRFKWCYNCKLEVEKEWGGTYQKPDPIPPCEKAKKP